MRKILLFNMACFLFGSVLLGRGQGFEIDLSGAFSTARIHLIKTDEGALIGDFFDLLALSFNETPQARNFDSIEFVLSELDEELINKKFQFHAEGLTVAEIFYILRAKFNIEWEIRDKTIYIVPFIQTFEYERYVEINLDRPSDTWTRIKLSNSGSENYRVYMLGSGNIYFRRSGVWMKDLSRTIDNFSFILPGDDWIQFEVFFQENVDFIVLHFLIDYHQTIIGIER